MQEIIKDPSSSTTKGWMPCLLLYSLSSFTSFIHGLTTRCWWPTLYTQFTTITVPQNDHLVPLRGCWRVFTCKEILHGSCHGLNTFLHNSKKKGRVRRWSLTVYTASDQAFTGMLQYLQIILWLKNIWLKFYLVRIAKSPEWPSCQPYCSYMKQILQFCWTDQLII